ncbi:MAG TPA: Tex-like N-terminal domain-containing protein, partial [Polyangiaceae bacterium]
MRSPEADSSSFAEAIASKLSLPAKGVRATLGLFAQKATVPFIARYRKELTGGLDEVMLRQIEAEQRSLSELTQRKQTVIAALEKQAALTDELAARIAQCATRAELEDLYLPFKPRRRTRAQAARERGLEPLAERILAQALGGSLEREAQRFVSRECDVPDVAAAIQGAKDIVAEVVSERADVRALCREAYRKHGWVRSVAVKKATEKGPTKFEQYYDYAERVSKIPSHRYLAIRRGEEAGVLRVKIGIDEAEALLARMLRLMQHVARSPFGRALADAVHDGFERLLAGSIENELAAELAARSQARAIEVFADNLQHLLLAAPLGAKVVLGIDPGFRTGCKCAVVDGTGKLLEATT